MIPRSAGAEDRADQRSAAASNSGTEPTPPRKEVKLRVRRSVRVVRRACIVGAEWLGLNLTQIGGSRPPYTMRSALRYYVALVGGLALASLTTLDASGIWSLSTADLAGLAALIALVVLSEALAIPVVIGRHAGTTSITFLPLLACILVFGPDVTVLLIAVSGVVTQFAIHRKRLFEASFNISQWIVSVTAAGFVFEGSGGFRVTDAFDLAYVKATAVPFVLFGIVAVGVNHVAVAGFVALKEASRFRPVLLRLTGRSGTNLVYDLLVSPVAITVAFLYVQLHVAGLLLTLLPLLFIRHSYLTNVRLQQANRDLLEMMVKAIETRDPYTSGHSRRVATMARRIAELMRLPGKTCSAIETAALLHDIGKIDSAYVDIIRKPSQLSQEELQVIQSHATKGADLIRSLSSFGDGVVSAVRHHHERYDGRGYPAGLRGEMIPLGARVIMICDAVDAMLSDRPYRRALSVEEVREQLSLGKGRQFDPAVTARVLESDLLEGQHKEVVADGARGLEVTEWEGRAAVAGREFSVVQQGTPGRAGVGS